ncbi:hypothetical protein IFM89_020022 [Coptis chinensis]|uniref:Uncharacterized protein n=1 Tax=Coptis chinensis TaxID=261450 RepID=A0A835IR21_9MAGN|nr:hypothetical protein IFM89_020022 [Coptis chinensis]
MAFSSLSYVSLILIFMMVCTLFPHPSLAMRRLREVETDSEEGSLKDVENMLLRGEVGHLPRVKLHEVHSGPNPISNFFPQRTP